VWVDINTDCAELFFGYCSLGRMVNEFFWFQRAEML
jgi:hypothetical protein